MIGWEQTSDTKQTNDTMWSAKWTGIRLKYAVCWTYLAYSQPCVAAANHSLLTRGNEKLNPA